MPKANPFAKISKRLASLQAKSAKITNEIITLAKIVEVEMNNQADAPAIVKSAPAKKAAAPAAAPKKQGRPAKK